jgi:hypothetical protein
MDDEDNAPSSELSGSGREMIEKALRQQIVVDKFPLTSAGEPIANHLPTHNSNHQYDTHFHLDPNNLYAPFTSKLDWEIARWAKLRGPSSTAMSELLKVEGVSKNLCSLLLQVLIVL